MRFYRLIPAFLASIAVCSIAGACFAGQNWLGATVMPKSERVAISSENGAPVTLYDIAWPATVQKTRGRFLWVQDEGGYSRNQSGGWIYADDAVKLDDACDFYRDELQSGETAWLDWMSGIAWEAKGDPGIAILNYQNALAADPNSRIDDLHIRLGRIVAQQQLLGGRGLYNPAIADAWENHFEAAQKINPYRPQLYYEWGLALTQACACTQSRIFDAARAGPSGAAKTTDAPKSDNGSNDRSAAAKSAKPAESLDHSALRSDLATEPLPAGSAVGPTAAGAEAALQALVYYEYAEKISPRWWRIPLARAELMLNQCDQESPQGERDISHNTRPEFFSQLSSHVSRRPGRGNQAFSRPQASTADIAPAPPEAIQKGSGKASAPNGVANANAPAAGEATLPPYINDILAIALDDFNRSISLNSNALDAYRDRAEVLRLMGRLDEAEQSAVTACKLCYYRQPGSLRTLAQVNHDLKLNQQAADYALRAAELASGDQQQRYLQLWYTCSKQCSADTAKIAVASANAGYIASRGDSDESSDTSTPPVRIEPPPGFVSRAGSAVPD